MGTRGLHDVTCNDSPLKRTVAPKEGGVTQKKYTKGAASYIVGKRTITLPSRNEKGNRHERVPKSGKVAL